MAALPIEKDTPAQVARIPRAGFAIGGRIQPRNPREAQGLGVHGGVQRGGRLIEAQIASILSQLAHDDEIVIVDDKSQDDTVERITGIRDSRIRLCTHEKKEGVVATFEDALRIATGNILFLSDDDDLWAPAKVESVLQEFGAHPEVQVVASRVALIDERGAALPDSRRIVAAKVQSSANV